MGVTAAQQKVKDDKQRFRAVIAGDVTHIQLGKGRGDLFGSVTRAGRRPSRPGPTERIT